MSIIRFIKSKTFFKHLGISLIAAAIFFWLVFRWLGCYTDHGETIAVPDFNNVKITELDNFVEDKEVRYEIIDSVYDNKREKGVVIRQEPEANTQVKRNRTVYLYVTAVLPPTVEMPKLKHRSLRHAQAMLETYGLKLKQPVTFKPDQCVNCVLDQKYKGKTIEPGTKVEKGAVIELVVGKGLGDEEVLVPYLIGMTYEQAMEKLTEASLNPGDIKMDSKDTLKSRVYKQFPRYSRESKVNVGSSVDLFFTKDASKIPIVPDTSDSK
jgi:eukaryotic-like serine/threonine-protein kinase